MAKKTAKELIHEAEALIRAGRHDLAPGRFREAIRLVGDHPETPRIRARLGEGVVALLDGRTSATVASVADV